MLAFLVKRLAGLAIVLFALSIASFALLHAIPTDLATAAVTAAGLPPTPALVASTRVELGLDRSLPVQYLRWLDDVAHLDLGRSFTSRRPVTEMLLPPLMATLELASASFAIMLFGSVAMAVGTILSASRRVEAVVRTVTVAGAALPMFWFGFLLQYLFAMELRWLPLSGRGSWEHLLLPAITLAVTDTVVLTRILRSSVGREMRRTYVQVARAKGVRETAIVLRHVLPNALTAYLTAFGLAVGNVLGGAVVVEAVFGWPGIGEYALRAILDRDYPVIQSYVLLVGFIFVMTSFFVDLALMVINGRTHGAARA